MRTKLSQTLHSASKRALSRILPDRRLHAPGRDDGRSAKLEPLDATDRVGVDGSEAGVPERAQFRQSLSLVATRAVIAACVLGALPLIGFGTWAMIQVDRQTVAREETLLRRGFEAAVAAVSHEQKSATNWDDAVTRARARDQDWLADNLGVWMHEHYGHDRAYLLDERNQAIHAMLDGETHFPGVFASDAEPIAPLIAQVRSILPVATDLFDVVAREIVTIGGRPAVVSVRPIVPESDQIWFAPVSAYLHIAVQYVDAAFLTALGDRYSLQDVRLLPHAEGRNRITVHDAAWRPLADIVWSPTRPGRHVVKRTLPGVVVSAFALFGLIGGLLLRLRSVACQVVASETEARHRALHDTLTGLPNRALFNERIGEALAAAEHGGGRVALHYLDLDRFKIVNDTLGHPAGDELIRQVSERLGGLIRKGDTVARLGGDEFAIIQRDLRGPDDARHLAERALREISAPFSLGGNLAYVGVSIGIVLGPKDDDTRDEFLRKADIALYQAKGAGKGRFCLFEPALDEIVRQKRAIERDLRESLETGADLRVVYQAIYAADGATLVGVEALLRWGHPAHGKLSPALFVAVAEERGLMPKLGSWVLREACQTAKDLDLPWIAVNVSAVQFREADFADSVLDLLKEIGLSPERLQLEITEGLFLDATDAVGSAINRLRFAGVCIALDDFGTGYSSLHYLNRYKVDKIKIDRSFVQQLGTAADSDAIVRAMLDLARALRLDVTAEGVETREQWEALNSLGAPEMQGYLFSPPVGRDVLWTLFADRSVARRSA